MDSSRGKSSSPTSNQSSDSDNDWTLVSPPHSSTSSLEKDESVTEQSGSNATEAVQETGAAASTEEEKSSNIIDDGLSEIDLKEDVGKRSEIVASTTEGSSSRSSSSELSIHGFKPLDSTTDESNGSSRRSSLSSTDEFPDFVHLNHDNSTNETQAVIKAKKPKIKEIIRKIKKVEDKGFKQSKRISMLLRDHDDYEYSHLKRPRMEKSIICKLDTNRIGSGNGSSNICKTTKSIQAKLDELSDHFAPLSASSTQTKKPTSLGGWTKEEIVYTLKFLIGLFALIAVMILVHQIEKKRAAQSSRQQILSDDFKHHHDPSNAADQFIDPAKTIPASNQYLELHLLQTELSLCIKRQSPSSFKYYIARDHQARGPESATKSQQQQQHHKSSRAYNGKPYRGLVCYGQEMEWRRRFDQLKQDLDLDLPQLLKEAKESVTNEMLTNYHPALQFKLILNQIEYLNYLEAKRVQRQSEETIKHLKAENLQLARKMGQPSGSNASQKLVVKLELENSKLRRENEALKASLVEKAGPVYIKQAIEKDQADRENKVLKKFLFDVNKAVAWGLRKFNIHTIDASMELDQLEVIEAQVSSTKGYLYRLTDMVSKVLMDNESLKEQLKETHLQLRDVELAEEMPLVSASSDRQNDNGDNSSSSSRALVLDSCMHDLRQMREKSDRLEEEVLRLRRGCNNNNWHFGLQKSSDRSLNHTKSGQMFDQRLRQFQVSKLAETSLAESKSVEDDEWQTSILADDIIDDMMLFLNKFNQRMDLQSPVKSNSLTAHRSRSLFQSHQDSSDSKPEIVESKVTATTTTLPNYIQEAVRIPKVKISSISDENVARLRLPPTSPPTTYFHNQSTRDSVTIAPRSLQLPTPTSATTYSYHQTGSSRYNSREADTIDQQVSQQKRNISSTPVSPSDSWFLRRAKQRSELRRPIELLAPNWAIKRAKLREKLRTASAYIDSNAINNNHNNDSKVKPRPPTFSSSSSTRKDNHQDSRRKYSPHDKDTDHHSNQRKHNKRQHKWSSSQYQESNRKRVESSSSYEQRYEL